MSEENGNENVIENTKKYIEIMEHNIKLLEDATPEDRLSYVKECIICVQVLNVSLKGWAGWLGNFSITEKFTLDELKELYPKMKQLVIDFVKLDIEATKKKTDEEEKKITKSKPSKKDKYVS
jgi:hypothetical protein